MTRSLRPWPALALAAAATLAAGADAKIDYPAARKADVVQDYFGTRVADPYRWLEDADLPETAKWVEANNAITEGYLAGPERESIRKRLTELYDYPRTSAPEKQGTRYFLKRNTGLQNQSVLFVREGLKGAERVLIDPNALSADGTVALTSYSATQDGALLGYSLSRSGSDRQEIYVRDVATGKDLADKILWAKFTNLSWTPDKSGFYYTRFPQPGTVPKEDENYFSKVYFHKLGDAQEKDALVFDSPERKELLWIASLSLDGRYLVITGFEGSSSKAEVWVLDRSSAAAKPEKLFAGFADAFTFVGAVDGRLFFLTDKGAPLWRIGVVDFAKGSRELKPAVAEGKNRIEEAFVVNRQLVVHRLHNASSEVAVHGLDGALVKTLTLPALGTVAFLTGDADDDEMFFEFTSFAYPTTPYRYDFKTGTLAAFEESRAKVRGGDYDVTQVWYPSKDGTKVSMFIVSRKGLTLDGNRPTMLSAYGGFNVSITPTFSASKLLWLERGGVYAVPNLRGGGEYGEAWHQAGMLEKKQNVFDDFIAAGEWLIANKYTRKERLVIQGGSNGGLLVGAAMVQRPDLFGAVVCQVPVADMLRYHLFTVGRFWIPEYGSADDAKQFPFLFRYSPYHNVKDGVAYPPTLVTTADTDDRVAPGLAKKFAARLQAANGGPNPMLIRVETKAGHGGGKPISKQIDEMADIYAFVYKALGTTGTERADR
jgi:prolyl oligopeptidase